MRANNFRQAIEWAINELIDSGELVDAGRWQGIQTKGHPSLMTKELLSLGLQVPVNRPHTTHHTMLDQLAEEIRPNREWADEHFEERVGGKPLNPDPSHERWPWWRGQDDTTKVDGKFSHTYSERFWPRYPVGCYENNPDYPHNRQFPDAPVAENKGIRYRYGDLSDVVEQLYAEPYNRQAYLPIFFPEDTGAVHGGRVPCTLGYHFMLRQGRLHMWYDIRSCDAVRHFRDDIYLAVRLQLWMIERLNRVAYEREQQSVYSPWLEPARPGTLYFCAHSFHAHMGDFHMLVQDIEANRE